MNWVDSRFSRAGGRQPRARVSHACRQRGGLRALPPDVRRRLPEYSVPAARIGELAVDNRCKGKGLGSLLLIDAFERIANASREVGVWAVAVGPIDQQAAGFYRHFGFEPLLDSDTLFLTMHDLTAWLE